MLMCQAASLIPHFRQLGEMRNEFAQTGFSLSLATLRRIESMRRRRKDEADFAFYSGERFLESLSFPGGRWRRSGRHSTALSFRSSYIDFLCEQFADRDAIFGRDNSDTIAAYDGAMDLNADPNYLVYSRLDFTNEKLVREYAKENENLIQAEIFAFNEPLGAIAKDIKVISPNGLERMFAIAAEKAGIKFIATGARPRLVLTVGMASSCCSMYLEWGDELLMRKWGKIQLVFSFGSSDGGIVDLSSNNFRCSLDSFIPGGDAYTRTGTDVLRVALCVFAHVEFMRIVKECAGNGVRCLV